MKPTYSQLLSELQNSKLLNAQLDNIIECIYDGIYITDGDANTLKVNKAYETVSGLDRKRLIGQNMKTLEKEGLISQSCTLLVLDSGKKETVEQTFKNGRKVLASASPVFDENGRIVMVVTSVRDLTELYELKLQLKNLGQKYHSQLETIKKQLLQQDDIIAVDKKSIDLLVKAKKVAETDATALILGPTGVGKEEIAKYIHKHSDRKKGPFIQINCGAIPETLIESELFGYEKGAFTGAHNQGKMGLFEAADQGTIFLDEIGELPHAMQVKLLRVLQEKKIERIGSHKSTEINIRILAATNRDLKQMVEENLFRADLYYRLLVVPIELLPLKDRKDDIVPLVNHFLTSYNKKYGMQKQCSQELFNTFYHYGWPGNVRELKNTIEQLVIMTDHAQITPQDLLVPMPENAFALPPQEMNLKQRLEEIELQYLEKAYESCGNVRAAAKKLQMDPSTFVRRKNKLQKKQT